MAIGAREKHPHDVLLGEFLDGEFALVDILGVGGFGTVYKAIQFPVRRPVAVKVLHSHYYRHEGVRQRFFQEARAIGSLTDSSIVKLIRFGEIEPGQPLPGCGGYFFMAQEFISGLTLRDATRQQGQFPAERAVRIALQILRALADAHRRGVVHRDLKPGNIMLTRDALGEESARVLDFGVAKMLETIDDPNEHTPDTLTGVMLGTPNYMAPEQIHGDEIKPATDLYAVGILLYEMISGKRPFHRTTRAETLRAQLTESAPKLTAADGVSDELAEVINKALHKDAGQRFHDAVSFIRALQGRREQTNAPQAVSETPVAPLDRPSLEPIDQTMAASAPVSMLQTQTAADDHLSDASQYGTKSPRNRAYITMLLGLVGIAVAWLFLNPQTDSHTQRASKLIQDGKTLVEDTAPQAISSPVKKEPAVQPVQKTPATAKTVSPKTRSAAIPDASALPKTQPEPQTMGAAQSNTQTKPKTSAVDTPTSPMIRSKSEVQRRSSSKVLRRLHKSHIRGQGASARARAKQTRASRKKVKKVVLKKTKNPGGQITPVPPRTEPQVKAKSKGKTQVIPEL